MALESVPGNLDAATGSELQRRSVGANGASLEIPGDDLSAPGPSRAAVAAGSPFPGPLRDPRSVWYQNLSSSSIGGDDARIDP
ncbi:hypothetical protein E5288_WYG007649 [Bos mutus]|uniref:Uncharacterized protein n=1 Tax=Bos mutus TaxID=72004 RepID=A0A6B0RGX6_9CETA|nr:hypothetical protein [Bos mutus]